MTTRQLASRTFFSWWLRACVASICIAGMGVGAVFAAAPERCNVRLQIKFEPGAPNPRDPAFLSGLLANPLYSVRWIGGTDTFAEYELAGPASDYQCENEVELIRRNANVIELKVLPQASKLARQFGDGLGAGNTLSQSSVDLNA